MSGALPYLVLTRLKNQIKNLLRSPAKLIYALIIIALLAFVLFAGHMGDSGEYRDRQELGGIAIAFYTLIFLLTANSGFSTGASIFKMSDVQLLFTGPFPRNRVLFYSLFQQLGTSLLMGFFILFQYGWMRDTYGVEAAHLLVLLVFYGLVTFSGQLCAMLIYALTASDTKKRRAARCIFVGVPAAYALWLFYVAATAEGGILPALVKASGTLALRLFPVSGWLGGAAGGILTGNWAALALGLGIWLAVLLGAVLLLRTASPDYYEDVLLSTETSHAQKTAAKEGRITEVAPKKVRPGKTGLGGGMGASAFFYKHKIENRRSRRFLLSGVQLIFAVCTIGFSFFMRNLDAAGFVGVITFSVYMQFFSVALGRLPKELTKPFIFLVPESSVKKLLWCMRESLSGFVLEAVLIFVPVCLLFGFGPVEMAACVLMRLGFDYLFLAGNLAAERIFGSISTKTLIMLFFLLLLAVLSIPGIVLAIILSALDVVIYSGIVTSCLALTVCNLPIALLVVFLCRNLLDNMEVK